MQTGFHEWGHLPENTSIKIAQFRHKVFVQRLGWDLPEDHNGLEYDQYDCADTLYITLRNKLDEIVGFARLLPTTGHYLLKDHFSQLLGNMPAPSSNQVWELSRLAAEYPPRTTPTGKQKEWAIHKLLTEIVRAACGKGAKQLIGVTYMSMERLFSRIGIQAHRLGPVSRVDGRLVVACRIDLNDQTLRALGLANKIQKETIIN